MKFSIIHCIVGMVVVIRALGAPTVCISTPVLIAEAGSTVQATIDGSLSGRRCEATLKFSNQSFPHIYFGFNSLTCLGGLQIAEFGIPAEVPSGDAFLLWDCTGQGSPVCNHFWISGGTDDIDSIVLDQNGTIACLVPTGTETTLTTITGASEIVTESVTSTLFEELLPVATTDSLVTVTELSNTIVETLASTYFSTLSSVSTAVPGSSSTVIPGSSSTVVPGSSSTVVPGSSSTVVPGSSSTVIPGSSSTVIPGSSSTIVPGSSSTVVPGSTTSPPLTSTATTSASSSSSLTIVALGTTTLLSSLTNSLQTVTSRTVSPTETVSVSANTCVPLFSTCSS